MTAGAGGGLAAALAARGLVIRGWVPAGRAAETPLSDGEPARAIALVGHLGGGFWPVFEAWRAAHPDLDNPLDAWSKAVIAPLAQASGGEAVFPSDRPYHPFQRWAMEAEGLKPSPLGMLIHPVCGLWHGYRGAILFSAEAFAALGVPEAVLAAPEAAMHPCANCADKPCLSACPVSAFSQEGFDVAACRSHLGSDAGRSGCMAGGCLARDACPVGRTHRYSDAQIRFHMAAFR